MDPAAQTFALSILEQSSQIDPKKVCALPLHVNRVDSEDAPHPDESSSFTGYAGLPETSK